MRMAFKNCISWIDQNDRIAVTVDQAQYSF